MEAYEVKYKLVCEQSLMVKAENQKDAKTKARLILSNTDAHDKLSGSVITKTTILDAKARKHYAWVNFEDYNINGIGGHLKCLSKV